MKTALLTLVLIVFAINILPAQNDDVYFTPGPAKDSSDVIKLEYSFYSTISGKELNYLNKTQSCLDVRYRKKAISRLHEGATMMYLTKNDIVDEQNPKYLVGVISGFKGDTIYMIHADGDKYRDYPVALADLTLVGVSPNPNDFIVKEGEKPYASVRIVNLNKPFYTAEIRNVKDRKYQQTTIEFISPVLLQILVDLLVVGMYSLTYW